MNFFKLVIVLILFSCKTEIKKTVEISMKPNTEPTGFVKTRKKLTQKDWKEQRLFTIEEFDENSEYYYTQEKENLKQIYKIDGVGTINWLCIYNKDNWLVDYAKIGDRNKNGILDISAKIIEDMVVRTTDGLLYEQAVIDTLYILPTAIRNSTKENKVIGSWFNNTSNLKFILKVKEDRLQYTFISPIRRFTGMVYITDRNLIVFNGFEWSEYAGGAIDDGGEGLDNYSNKMLLPLPTEIGCGIDLKKNEFVIQNTGNAMNYFTKIEEASEKFVLFKKQ